MKRTALSERQRTELWTFYTARLDEDEAVAQAADAGPWEVGPTFGARDSAVYIREEDSFIDWVGSTYVPPVFTSQVPNKTRFRENARHIARHDPARVLREVEARRRVLTSWQNAAALVRDMRQPGFVAYAEAWEHAVRLLAEVWDQHPDWQECWRMGTGVPRQEAGT